MNYMKTKKFGIDNLNYYFNSNDGGQGSIENYTKGVTAMDGFDEWLQDESAYGSLTQTKEHQESYDPGAEPDDVAEKR